MIFDIQHILSAEKFTVDLLNIISSIDREFFPTPWDSASWQHVFEDSTRLLSIISVDNKCVGFALLNFNAVDSFAHLLKIIVIPKFQKNGVAQRLLISSIELLSGTQNIQNYFLEVEITNANAIQLYQKNGFCVIHTKKNFYGANRDAFIMTLSTSVKI